VSGTAVGFAARDGTRLAGTLYRPRAPNRRAVLVQAASGVKQEYYARFAAYLAERGFTVLTFDYRGIGRSRPAGALRGFRATMRDWAEKDIAGALDHLERATHGARLIGVGHSFGGQAFGLVPGNERYAAALAFGSQSGYWRHWSGRGRAAMWFLTHLLLPGASRALGYFPTRRFGQGEDLPKGVALEWASWCRHPGYLVGALGANEAYAGFKAPIRAYVAADDSYAPPKAVEAFLAFYPGSSRKLIPVDPAADGGGPVGHFGYFRERFKDSLWRAAADWLANA
jgi:predicted alpha/beta hydrolase